MSDTTIQNASPEVAPPLADQIIAARYAAAASAVDAYGREITVRRVRPSDQMRISNLSDNIGTQALMLQAGAVVGIKEAGGFKAITRTVDAKRLLSLIDELDTEGMKAVEIALATLNGVSTTTS